MTERHKYVFNDPSEHADPPQPVSTGALNTLQREWLAAHDQKVRAEVCEAAALLVDKAFEQSWVVQDTLDAIRSLASGAVEKK